MSLSTSSSDISTGTCWRYTFGLFNIHKPKICLSKHCRYQSRWSTNSSTWNGYWFVAVRIHIGIWRCSLICPTPISFTANCTNSVCTELIQILWSFALWYEKISLMWSREYDIHMYSAKVVFWFPAMGGWCSNHLPDDVIKCETFSAILAHCSDVELSCFLWCAPEQTAEQTFDTPVI